MSTPDQQPTHPPTEQGPPAESADRSSVDETYHTVAETVGGIPSFRKKDNLRQALCIVVALVLGIAIGGIVGGLPGLFVGGFIGLLGGLLGSGIFLMILGWLRVFKRRKQSRP